MQVLTKDEMAGVFGGDRWCDTPEGRARFEPSMTPYERCMADPDVVRGSQARAEIAGTYCAVRLVWRWIKDF